MKEQEKQSQKEANQAEKRITEDAKNLAREQQTKKIYLAKEQEREKAAKEKETERAKKRTAESIKELERENTRKEAYLAREKIIASEREARNKKNKG
jgi:hypothetical protein